MNTTTEHLKALLVDDGREFAMVRKADLAAVMAASQAMGRLLAKKYLAERKHGEERRRYMANNKALQARVTQLEREGVDDALLALSLTCEVVPLRHAVAAAIRKAPTTCRMLGLTK